MDKYRIIMNLEVGFRLEVIKPNGFIRDKYDINQEELGENIDDLCLLVTGDKEDAEKLKEMLRFGYTHMKAKSFTFSLKEKE